MKATAGIVRDIDKLGRVVIPMEIRRRLKISDGNHIEITLEGDNIILRKFDPAPDIQCLLGTLRKSIAEEEASLGGKKNVDTIDRKLGEVERLIARAAEV